MGKSKLHSRCTPDVPKNIHTPYDAEDYDYFDDYFNDYFNDYHDNDNYGWDENEDVFVISKSGVYVTDGSNYYSEVDLEEGFDIQDFLRERYVIYDKALKRQIQNKYPEYFI